jgi:hypothetical protein
MSSLKEVQRAGILQRLRPNKKYWAIIFYSGNRIEDVSLLLDKNEEKPSTEAYRIVTDLQNSGGDLQVVDKVGVPDGI